MLVALSHCYVIIIIFTKAVDSLIVLSGYTTNFVNTNVYPRHEPSASYAATESGLCDMPEGRDYAGNCFRDHDYMDGALRRHLALLQSPCLLCGRRPGSHPASSRDL